MISEKKKNPNVDIKTTIIDLSFVAKTELVHENVWQL